MVVDWSKYLANGIPVTADNPAQPRKEIRDLKPEERWLYLQGLAKFQAQSTDDPMSYYQLAGIHGLPATTWPNLPDNNEIPHDKGANTGFCTHTSIIFLTWHRPYLALFESALYKHVNDIANGINSTFAGRDTYLKAAKSFRMPYWDWARNDRQFPEDALISDLPPKTPSFTVKNFDGAKYNPLLYYKFPDGTPDEISWGNSTTVRRPAERDVAQSLRDQAKDFRDTKGTPRGSFVPREPPQPRNLTERLSYQLLSYQRFGPMSNNAFLPDKSDPNTANAEIWGSVEDIHNAVHVFCGGRGGHMGDTSVAGFDPVFWLHHANIDRLFAIWQAMNPSDQNDKEWVTDQRSWGPGWANGDQIVDPKTGRKTWGETVKTKLYPFRQDVKKDAWYDSTMVKRTEDFGYTYPETAGLPSPMTDAAKPGLVVKINTLYPPPAKAIAMSMRKVNTAGEQLLPQATILKQIDDEKVPATHAELTNLVQQLPEQQVLLKASLEPEKPRLRKLASDDNRYLEWLFNIKAEKHALGGKYSVSVFLGAVQEDSVALWPFSPHYVGTFYPFGQNADTQCGKCKEDQADQLQITGQIPLTVALMERYLAGMVESLDVEPVTRYLKANLHWRLESNGTVLDDRSQLPGLKVFVVSNEVTIPEDENQTPTYAHDVVIHPEITTKEDGSAGRGEGTGLAVGET